MKLVLTPFSAVALLSVIFSIGGYAIGIAHGKEELKAKTLLTFKSNLEQTSDQLVVYFQKENKSINYNSMQVVLKQSIHKQKDNSISLSDPQLVLESYDK